MTGMERLSRRPPLEGGIAPDLAPGERRQRRQESQPAVSYYDVPMLKPPVWTWEISTYFFLGGLSGGAFALARMADRFGGGRYTEVTRAGTAIAFTAFLPCTPLLIADLGDPKRFHYMLRVFKPKSPMNLGAWTLAAFGGVLTLSVLNEWRKAHRRGEASAFVKRGEASAFVKRGEASAFVKRGEASAFVKRGEASAFVKRGEASAFVKRGEASAFVKRGEASAFVKFAEASIDALADGVGVPLGLLLAGYTGVLLSTTSTPLWARNTWLGPLFSAGALSTGASAITLALEARGGSFRTRRASRALAKLGTAAKVAEAVALSGFLTAAGDLAKPVTQEKYAPHLWGGAVGLGLALSTVLETLPVKSERTRRWLRIAGAVAGLAGGFALRWAISQGGHLSGRDPQAAQKASQPTR